MGIVMEQAAQDMDKTAENAIVQQQQQLIALLNPSDMIITSAIRSGENSPTLYHWILGSHGSGKSFLAKLVLKGLHHQKKLDASRSRKAVFILPKENTLLRDVYEWYFLRERVDAASVLTYSGGAPGFIQVLRKAMVDKDVAYIFCDQLEDLGPRALRELCLPSAATDVALAGRGQLPKVVLMLTGAEEKWKLPPCLRKKTEEHDVHFLSCGPVRHSRTVSSAVKDPPVGVLGHKPHGILERRRTLNQGPCQLSSQTYGSSAAAANTPDARHDVKPPVIGGSKLFLLMHHPERRLLAGRISRISSCIQNVRSLMQVRAQHLLLVACGRYHLPVRELEYSVDILERTKDQEPLMNAVAMKGGREKFKGHGCWTANTAAGIVGNGVHYRVLAFAPFQVHLRSESVLQAWEVLFYAIRLLQVCQDESTFAGIYSSSRQQQAGLSTSFKGQDDEQLEKFRTMFVDLLVAVNRYDAVIMSSMHPLKELLSSVAAPMTKDVKDFLLDTYFEKLAKLCTCPSRRSGKAMLNTECQSKKCADHYTDAKDRLSTLLDNMNGSTDSGKIRIDVLQTFQELLSDAISKRLTPTKPHDHFSLHMGDAFKGLGELLISLSEKVMIHLTQPGTSTILPSNASPAAASSQPTPNHQQIVNLKQQLYHLEASLGYSKDHGTADERQIKFANLKEEVKKRLHELDCREDFPFKMAAWYLSEVLQRSAHFNEPVTLKNIHLVTACNLRSARGTEAPVVILALPSQSESPDLYQSEREAHWTLVTGISRAMAWPILAVPHNDPKVPLEAVQKNEAHASMWGSLLEP